MNKINSPLFYILLWFIFVSVSFGQINNKTAKKIYNKKYRFIGEVYSDNGYGTGFLLHESGVFVTAWHVISEAKYIRVSINGREYRPYGIYSGERSGIDLAIMKLESIGNLGAPRHRLRNDVNILDPILMISNPSGLPQTVSKGVISNILINRRNENEFYLGTANSSSGSSGAPVFDSSGDLIGVHVASYSGQNQHIIPIKYAWEIIENGELLPIHLVYNYFKKKLFKKRIKYISCGLISLGIIITIK